MTGPTLVRPETPRSHIANALQILNVPHTPVPAAGLFVMVEAVDLDRIRVRLTEALRQLDGGQ